MIIVNSPWVQSKVVLPPLPVSLSTSSISLQPLPIKFRVSMSWSLPCGQKRACCFGRLSILPVVVMYTHLLSSLLTNVLSTCQEQRDGAGAQWQSVVSMQEALGSIPSTDKKRKKKETHKEDVMLSTVRQRWLPLRTVQMWTTAIEHMVDRATERARDVEQDVRDDIGAGS